MKNGALSLPSPEDQVIARESVKTLSNLLKALPDTERAKVQLEDQSIILPRNAIELLMNLLREMSQGNAVSVVPTHAELTTQQAADILNVSRPHLIKLLNEGKLEFFMKGTHRRIHYCEVINYQKAILEEGSKKREELVKLAQELDMGY